MRRKPSTGQSVAKATERENEVLRQECERLQERLSMLETMLNQLPAIVWYTRGDENEVLYVTPEFQRITGIETANLLADPSLGGKPLHPEDSEKVFEAFRKGTASRQPFDVEHRLIHLKTGKISWIRQRVLPVHDENGYIKGQVAVCLDITREKEAEFRSQRLERQFSVVVENCSDMVTLCDPEGTAFYINRAGVRTLRCQTEEDAVEWLSPRAQRIPEPVLRHIYESMQRGDTSGPVAFDLARRDGTTANLEGSVTMIRDEERRPMFAATILRDVSEREQAYQALRESESKLSTILQYSPVALYGFREDGEVVFWNQACEGIFGLSRGEILGNSLQGTVYQTAPEKAERLISLVFSGETVEDPEAKEITRDGQTRYILSSSYPVRTEEGPVFLGVTANVDITERKLDEEERSRLQENLARSVRMESIGVLAGGIAHDFNNLLVGIIGNASLLKTELGGNKRSGRCIEDLLQAAERAADLTRQLLAYARGGKYEPEVLALNDVVSDIVPFVRSGLSCGVTLRVVLDPEAGSIEADPRQVKQVVMNLCVNAAESMAQGGVVELSTSQKTWTRAGKSEFILGEPTPGDWAVLRVEDAGAGIPPNLLDRVFDPFFTTKQLGRGLGLSAVSGIVANHSGFIRVVSREEKGSIFEVCFPVVSEKGSAGSSALDDFPEDASLILVVEDEPLVQSLIERALGAQGYGVLPSSDPAEALRQVENWGDRIRFVILEPSVTGVGRKGLRFIQRVRSSVPGVPILLTSGYHEKEILADMLNEEEVEFVAKPYSSVLLEQKTREMIRGNVS